MNAIVDELLTWGLSQDVPFSKNAAEKAVAGRATDKRAAIEALIDRGDWIRTGEYRKHPLYSDATSSSSGTKL